MSPRPRAVAFIVSRLTSSRLPAKQLRTIGDRPLMEWIVDELRRSKRLNEIVVATVSESANLPLREFCDRKSVACFWYNGDVNHVTTRLRRAAEFFGAEIGVLVSGDCPLLQAEAIDEVIDGLERDREGSFAAIKGQGDPPALQGIVAGRLSAWQRADDLADLPELKEHQFPLLAQRPDLFRPVPVRLAEELCMPYHRLSVDTIADLEFLHAVWERLTAQGRPFNLREAVRLLKAEPGLREINAHVHQRGVEERARTVLFMVDAGEAFGFGHLTRSIELAQQTVERLSWPVHFVIDHEAAADRLAAEGFQTSQGAFARPGRNLPERIPRFESDFRPYDLIVLDIFDGRGPKAGWRQGLGINRPVAVVENFGNWVREADLLIAPNVLGKGAERFPSGKPVAAEGASHLILRKEVRRQAARPQPKTLDLLAYLHDPRQRDQVRDWAVRAGIRVEIPDGFSDSFLEQLARSRVFLSGFGVSFYEALMLGAVPVCWPDTSVHRDDARRFYRWWGVRPLIVESISDLDQTVHSGSALQEVSFPVMEDGTPLIVDRLRALVEGG